jgi:thiamine kinase-like enzyme
MDEGVDDRVAAVLVELGLEQPTVTMLQGGPLNRAFRLKDAQRDLVLRLSGTAAAALGADHAAELAMQKLAADTGLAPVVVLARPAEGLLVTRHVAGRVLTRDEAREPALLARIGAWLAKLHALPPPAELAPIDIAARAAGYLEFLIARESTLLLRDLERHLSRLRTELPPPPRLAPCHHDLHHFNLVDAGGRLVALDWEYAGPGDPVADLAACICYQDLGQRRVEMLLDAYDRDAARIKARLRPLVWVFDCLCYGWMEVAAAHGIAADPERRRRLIRRLTA